MELSYEGGLKVYLETIIKANNGAAIIAAFKEIITKSVGRRSEDGRRFVKSPDITNEFVQTEAYSELFMELVTSANAAAEFVRGIVPQEMSEAVAAASVETVEDQRPAWIRENREPNSQELTTMTQEQLREAFAAKQARLGG